MAYDCKVYDKNGNLKKIFRSNENFSGVIKTFLDQKSTKRALSYIKTMRDPKIKMTPKTKFYDKKCVFCKMNYHPRYPRTKYCSHECQYKFYKQKKQLRIKIGSINSGRKT